MIITSIHAEYNEHILRSLKGCVDFDDVKKCQEMITLLQTALHRKHELQAQGIQQMADEKYKAIEEEFLNIAEQTVKEYYDEHPDIETKYVLEAIKTLKRMKEYIKKCLLFLRDFSVFSDNNEVEIQARICKIFKKISGQCATLETGKHKMVMLSVLQTAMKQKQNTLETLENILNSG